MESSAPNQPGELENKRIAFVGRLFGMSRRDVSELVRKYGAKVSRKLDAKLNLIVLADDLSMLLDTDNWLTPEMADALSRGELEVISETELWQRLSEFDAARNNGSQSVQADASKNVSVPLTRLYTPSMLASMLDVPVATIRQWSRMGLIHPVRQVKKLPYYDLREVDGARSLAQLLEKGVSPALIKEKIEQLGKYLPDAVRSLDQLSILLSGKKALFRIGADLVDTRGQFHFDLDGAPDYELRIQNGSSNDKNSTDSPNNAPVGFPWELVDQQDAQSVSDSEPEPTDFASILDLALMDDSAPLPVSEQTLREDIAALQQAGDWDNALAAARLLLLAYRSDSLQQLSEDNVVLADILFQLGRIDAAEERLLIALEYDSDNLESRLNLGCLLKQQGNNSAALSAFKGCLDQFPDYADAHYHIALLLDELERSDEALVHWQKFWDLTPSGPWKTVAAERLGLEYTEE
ncbi:MAG: tetratricopeptide repeat protein [Thermoguttaceae bacterium]|nr:tetratricopeptide repeat protein [Thermoguttaceae bacterium]